MVGREWFRAKARLRCCLRSKALRLHNRKRKLVLPGGCGGTSHRGPQAPSLESRGQWRRGVQIQPSSPDPTRSEFPLPFLLSAGFPCDTPKLACHRDTARLDSRHFFGIPPRPQSSRAAALTHPFPRPTRHPLGRRMSWAEKGPWPRNCIWYPHRLPLCPRLDLVPGNPGIASAVFSYSNREETP